MLPAASGGVVAGSVRIRGRVPWRERGRQPRSKPGGVRGHEHAAMIGLPFVTTGDRRSTSNFSRPATVPSPSGA